MSGWTEAILHVDMDAFFVEVERLRDPSLRGRPVAVGGTAPRSVVASASYEARRFGVRSAMPVARATRLCPELVIVHSDHFEYSRVSERVFEVFHSFTPLVEGLSLDEAFLDVSGLARHYPSSTEVASEIRRRIASQIGIPSSVGVASNKLLAKLASREAKPDGMFRIPADRIVDFLNPLPVDRLWGVGPATQAALARLGVTTVGELAAISDGPLKRSVGAAMASHLKEMAEGSDSRPVVAAEAVKSLSVEQTFGTDLVDEAEIEAAFRAQAEKLGGRLRRAGVRARVISIKVRLADFTTIVRSETLPSPTDVGHVLSEVAARLYRRSDVVGSPLRLVGITGGNLIGADAPRQLTVDDDPRWSELDRAVDAVRKRFGDELLGRPPTRD